MLIIAGTGLAFVATSKYDSGGEDMRDDERYLVEVPREQLSRLSKLVVDLRRDPLSEKGSTLALQKLCGVLAI